MFEVSGEEWQLAKKLLADKLDGYTVRRTATKMPDGLVPRVGDEPGGKYEGFFARFEFEYEQQLTCSFIKINGKVYAIAPGKGEDAIWAVDPRVIQK